MAVAEEETDSSMDTDNECGCGSEHFAEVDNLACLGQCFSACFSLISNIF